MSCCPYIACKPKYKTIGWQQMNPQCNESDKFHTESNLRNNSTESDIHIYFSIRSHRSHHNNGTGLAITSSIYDTTIRFCTIRLHQFRICILCGVIVSSFFQFFFLSINVCKLYIHCKCDLYLAVSIETAINQITKMWNSSGIRKMM